MRRIYYPSLTNKRLILVEVDLSRLNSSIRRSNFCLHRTHPLIWLKTTIQSDEPIHPTQSFPMSFANLGLSTELLTSLHTQGISAPSAIQEVAIPQALLGKDIWATAQTGSGKTLAFTLPILQALDTKKIQKTRRVEALILAPTRELAAQIGQVIEGFKGTITKPFKLVVVHGGVSINPQMLRLRGGADIVVATPGRLLDLVQHNAVDLSNVKIFILDEADRLLGLGFSQELSSILDLLPAKRQNLLFSATLGNEVQSLADLTLHDPLKIEIKPQAEQALDIHQRAIMVDNSQRTQLLRHLIQTEKWNRALVFVATKFSAEIVADKLRKAKILAEPFHGQLSQGKRTQVLADFKASKIQVVIATDVASRGLDIAMLPTVINYDLPRSTQDYIHRIGRTARAGASGLVVSFVSAESEGHWQLIQKRLALQLSMETIKGFESKVTTLGNAESKISHLINLDPNGGIKGKRPNKKDKLRQAKALDQSAKDL